MIDRNNEQVWQATFDLENAVQHLSTYRDEKNEASEAVWEAVQEAWTGLLAQLEERFGKRTPEWDIELPTTKAESKLWDATIIEQNQE